MALYVISDLHLSFSEDKPMDIFGDKWQDHHEKIENNWKKTVKDGDQVVIPGDTSWAMQLDDFMPDLIFLENLPGHKIISKGNHDYWWQSAKKLKEFKEKNNITSITFLHNNSHPFSHGGVEYLLCGTRGWKCPGDKDFTQEDMKIYKREVQRLERSILSGKNENNQVIAFIHYPPFNYQRQESDFTQILERYGVKECYYGHLHGENAHKSALNGKIKDEDTTSYYLVSSDYLDFVPFKIL